MNFSNPGPAGAVACPSRRLKDGADDSARLVNRRAIGDPSQGVQSMADNDLITSLSPRFRLMPIETWTLCREAFEAKVLGYVVALVDVIDRPVLGEVR